MSLGGFSSSTVKRIGQLTGMMARPIRKRARSPAGTVRGWCVVLRLNAILYGCVVVAV
jgi:hypothetical protein